jgi:NAD(P)-dependent dehydrogenase (short-subunit alcohol dehydrogenase family)
MSALRFDQQAVFVAGGTSGINLAIADAFAARGASVAVMSRAQDKVDAAVASLRRHGGHVSGHAADVRNYDAVTAALAAARDVIGGFDVLVSGAAGNFPARALDMSPNGFKAVVDIDLIGAYHVLRAAHAHLKKPGASVIMISAPQAVHARAAQSHVCAAKAGADMLMRVVALEWAADGIRVNAVLPGPIGDTEGMRRLAPTPEVEARVCAAVPLGRMGRKEEVADLALFLASPMASFITGAVIPVDGGVTAVGNHYAG